MSLRSQLEAKARRSCTVPVQVHDPGPARAAVERAEAAAQRADVISRLSPDDTAKHKEKTSADRALTKARAALAGCYVQVEFAALPADEWEAIVAAHQRKDGEIDTAAALPVMAAACAADEDLRDEAWWTDQLARDVWSSGDRHDLYTRLLDLNWSQPPESVPKG